MEDLKEILKQVEENDCGGTNSEDCEKLMAFFKKKKNIRMMDKKMHQ